jgi:hypothetical protein
MISESGIWLSGEETDTHEFDPVLARAIIKFFPHVKSVVDIGCGNGKYVMNFMANGIPCKGYDGSPLTPKLTGGLCEVMDFSEPVEIGRFDLVLSLEVGEHIPAQYEQIFLDNLCNAATKFLLISWATEGQYGIGHVNCHANIYIINKLKPRGFLYVRWFSELLREETSLPWFENTLMLFIKWSR